MPSKKKEMRPEKRKKRGGEKVSADARTSQANILHLDQKAVMCQGRTWDFLSAHLHRGLP